jgi:hypothetical protein
MPNVRRAAAKAVELAGTPPLDLRQMARQWLRGTLKSGRELEAPEKLISYRDAAAGAWSGAQTTAAQLAAPVHEQLGAGALRDRLDRIEVECWAEFVRRVRVLAGEVA